MFTSLLVIIIGVVTFYLYSPFLNRYQPQSYSPNLPLTLEGPIAVNEKLDGAERIFENEIFWPESMAIYEGKLYSSLGDGRIVRIGDKSVETICRIGEECEGTHQENICGRPLGMRFSSSGILYVADAYHGLFSVDVKTGKKQNLLPSSKVVAGEKLFFLNSLAIDEEQQVIYLTQSTTKWNISSVVYCLFEHETSGRFLKYDMKHKTVDVLKTGLAFPNGVELAHDKKSVLMAEGNQHMIWRYHLKGPEKGQLKKMSLIFPGEIDNISQNKRGNYWVAVANVRAGSSPTFYDQLSVYPSARKAMITLYYIFSRTVSSILRLVPSPKVKEFAAELVNSRFIADIVKQHGAIVEFNDDGKIIQSLHSPSGKVSRISEVQEHNGYLYLGSWRNHYLLRLKLQ